MEVVPVKLFVATKAFIIFNGKVLILRESGGYKDGTNTGRWDLPGGRLEIGEYFNDALLREVQEETGLRVTIKDPLRVGEWRPVVRGEGWQIVGIFFECSSESSEIVLSTDHDAFEWIDPLRYKEYNLIENLKPVFERYLEKNYGR